MCRLCPDEVMKTWGSASKNAIAETLFDLRSKTFGKLEGAREEIVEEALKGLTGTNTTKEERSEELKDSFFSFATEARNSEKFKARVVLPEES